MRNLIWSVETNHGVSFDLYACHNLIQPLVLIKVNLSQSILYKTRLKILFLKVWSYLRDPSYKTKVRWSFLLDPDIVRFEN